MKGHIFNLLEDFIIESAGMNVYEEILGQCTFSTQTGFIRTANYPDEQLYELVSHTVAFLDISTRDAHFGFGRWVLPHLMKLIPAAMIDNHHPASFLATVDYIHRIELKKLYPDAKPPVFSYQDSGPSRGVLIYSSPRALFYLVEGILQGVADYYDTPMLVERCVLADQGEGVCQFLIQYG